MSDQTVEFFGEAFLAPERINTRRLLRFSAMADRGLDTDDTAGMAALDGLIDQCLRPEDIDRFDEVCDRERPSAEELMEFVAKMMTAITDRPTRRPSDSSDGPSTIEPKSTDDSFGRVMRHLDGRPDLQLIAMTAQQARSTA